MTTCETTPETDLIEEHKPTYHEDMMAMIAEGQAWQIPLPYGVIEESENMEGEQVALIYKYTDFVDEDLLIMLTINKRCIQIFTNTTMALACYHVARYLRVRDLRKAIPAICRYAHKNYKDFNSFDHFQIRDLVEEVEG